MNYWMVCCLPTLCKHFAHSQSIPPHCKPYCILSPLYHAIYNVHCVHLSKVICLSSRVQSFLLRLQFVLAGLSEVWYRACRQNLSSARWLLSNHSTYKKFMKFFQSLNNVNLTIEPTICPLILLEWRATLFYFGITPHPPKKYSTHCSNRVDLFGNQTTPIRTF